MNFLDKYRSVTNSSKLQAYDSLLIIDYMLPGRSATGYISILANGLFFFKCVVVNRHLVGT